MTLFSDYFARVEGRVDLESLRNDRVVIVGVGTVGSQIAYLLANSGVGHLVLIDGDKLDTPNLIRHALPGRYVGMNKAEALVLYLDGEIPRIRVEALARNVDATLSDAQIDGLVEGADLVIAATDDREAQRRIGRRALALDVPAIFPALYSDAEGEVILQPSAQLPCFFCWDGYRPNEESLRGVNALNLDALPIILLAVRLSLAIIDPTSEHRRLLAAPPGEPPYQIFVQRRDVLLRSRARQRPDCPSCAVGPARPENEQWEPLPPPPGFWWRPPTPQVTGPATPVVSRQRHDEPSSFGAMLIFGVGGLFLWCVAVYIVMAILFGEHAVESSSTYGTVTVALYAAPIPIAVLVGFANLVRQVQQERR